MHDAYPGGQGREDLPISETVLDPGQSAGFWTPCDRPLRGSPAGVSGPVSPRPSIRTKERSSLLEAVKGMAEPRSGVPPDGHPERARTFGAGEHGAGHSLRGDEPLVEQHH